MANTAIIIGAGPAGLTVAYELLLRTDITPIILEKSGDTGGLSKTINYKGNRIDIGGHRFFSKSDRVMEWWLNILSLDPNAGVELNLQYRNKNKQYSVSKSQIITDENAEKVMLMRKRISRIYFFKKLFAYPITLSWDTISKLGLVKIWQIFYSYLYI